jgi:hypothetical protein
MERSQPDTTSRWPAWLNATGLLIASFVGMAALSLQARPGAEIVAVALRFWWCSRTRVTDWHGCTIPAHGWPSTRRRLPPVSRNKPRNKPKGI